MKLNNKKRILLLSIITLSVFIVSFSTLFYKKDVDLYEKNIRITKNEKEFILNKKEYLIDFVGSVGVNYIFAHWDFFIKNLKYNLENIKKINYDVDNNYYPISIYKHKNISNQKDIFDFIFVTNDDNFFENKDNLKITYDYKKYDSNEIYEDQQGNLIFKKEIKSKLNLYENTHFYVYEIDDLIFNATDYYDFKFYYNDENEPIFSSKINGNDSHVLTSFERLTINPQSISYTENINNDYLSYTINIYNPSTKIYNSYQLNSIRILNKIEIKNDFYFYTLADANKNMKFIERKGDNLIYEIYNISPDNYNIFIQTTNYFKYNYLDKEFYPKFIYKNLIPKDYVSTIPITVEYSNWKKDDLIIKNIPIIKYTDDKKIKIMVDYSNKIEENSDLSLSIFYDKKNDILNDDIKESLELNYVETLYDKVVIYEINYDVEKEKGYEYSDFYFENENLPPYYLPFKFSNTINNNAEIINAEIINKENDKLTFNVTFENATILQMENIDLSYESNDNLRYASDYNNLQLIKKVSENENQKTYQFKLINLNNDSYYSNFKIYIPNNIGSKSNLINTKYETSYQYNYKEPNEIYFANEELYLEKNHYIYILLVIPIFFIVVFALYLINLYKNRKKINDMDDDF
ncbi:MAG: hypothetical protein HPAVJP_3150 [Candidatus Hepatoplasma vulgare]|nr:MAG: hypothetical protein HPAVJP_3150 [Candidatus Hepatoplasma sp.]